MTKTYKRKEYKEKVSPTEEESYLFPSITNMIFDESGKKLLNQVLKELIAQINKLSGYDISNVVPKHADLPAPTTLPAGTLYLVLADETHGGKMSVYKVVGGAWVYEAEFKAAGDTGHIMLPDNHFDGLTPPSAYPIGQSILSSMNPTNLFNSSYVNCLILTIKQQVTPSDIYSIGATQYLYPRTAVGTILFRQSLNQSQSSDAWGVWEQVAKRTDLTNYAPVVHSHDILYVRDTRNTNELPSYYYGLIPSTGGFLTEFKSDSVFGFTVISSGYFTLTTILRYPDSSGGQITQVAYRDDGSIYTRTSVSTTVWGGWQKIADSKDLNGKLNRIDKFGTYSYIMRNLAVYDPGAFVNNIIKITLPTGFTDPMFKCRIEGYSYGASWVLEVGAYLYGGVGWYLPDIKCLTHNLPGGVVRLGEDSSGKACIFLGDVGTGWAHANMAVTELLSGYRGAPIAVDGWTITNIASFTGMTVSHTYNNVNKIPPDVAPGTGAKRKIVEFTASGTFTLASYSLSIGDKIDAYLVSGGGAGANGGHSSFGDNVYGGYGGAGGFCKLIKDFVLAAPSYPIVVGAGGIPAANKTPGNGSNGGATTAFGVTVPGGEGGKYNKLNPPPNGGNFPAQSAVGSVYSGGILGASLGVFEGAGNINYCPLNPYDGIMYGCGAMSGAIGASTDVDASIAAPGRVRQGKPPIGRGAGGVNGSAVQLSSNTNYADTVSGSDGGIGGGGGGPGFAGVINCAPGADWTNQGGAGGVGIVIIYA